MHHFLSKFEKLSIYFTVFCMIVMISINMLQIFARYVLNYPIPWVYPTTMLLFVWITFIGAFIVYHQKKDIVVVFFINKMPLRSQYWIQLITDMLIIALLIVIIIQAPALIKQQASTMQIIPLPRYIQTIPLLVGLTFICLENIVDIVEKTRSLRQPITEKE